MVRPSAGHRPPARRSTWTRARTSTSATATTSPTRRSCARYRRLADDYFEADRYFDWCDSRLRHFDEIALEWFAGPDLDRVMVETVPAMFPAHEHDHFVAHFRGLLGLWCRDEADEWRARRTFHD